MPSKTSGKPTKTTPAAVAQGGLDDRVQQALAWLEAHATQRDRENLARFGIDAKNAIGVSMANIQALAKLLGRNHKLAAALWATGCYEARLLTAYVDDPELVSPEQMDNWCCEFDNWGVCDTLCFCLFDRTPHAWAKVAEWGGREEEFIKRAGFALLASLAGHDKRSGDEPFLTSLPLIEQGACDDRHLVKKGVSWALRGLGRRGTRVCQAAITVAERLAESSHPGARWVGRDALRDLTKRASALKRAAR
ncbi:DNA alkylation repair protein [uncultured Paludibaculum sp.]|uniref:DNA alkylation repair protein n=1 Tax=uncultured Paludibaculum sp. TaxID=1765020 RepID=UPI002AAB272E|nr:DNA alkylation repair protein [uncultured Paludibaculum sp.]